jgi:hypothetical protein
VRRAVGEAKVWPVTSAVHRMEVETSALVVAVNAKVLTGRGLRVASRAGQLGPRAIVKYGAKAGAVVRRRKQLMTKTGVNQRAK